MTRWAFNPPQILTDRTLIGNILNTEYMHMCITNAHYQVQGWVQKDELPV